MKIEQSQQLLSGRSSHFEEQIRIRQAVLPGQIRASGAYLREDGQAGVISHVDLVA